MSCSQTCRSGRQGRTSLVTPSVVTVHFIRGHVGSFIMILDVLGYAFEHGVEPPAALLHISHLLSHHSPARRQPFRSKLPSRSTCTAAAPLATPTHLNPSSPSASTTSSMAEPHTPLLLLGTDTRPPTPPPRITQPSTTVTRTPQASPLPPPHQPPPSKALQGGPPPPLQHRH